MFFNKKCIFAPYYRKIAFMSCILHIETSTEVCSVAVSEDGLAEFKREDFQGPQHAVQLGVFVDEALSFVDSHAMPLDAVAVSCGPGSYTGLRIGVSMAKGICYGRNHGERETPSLLFCNHNLTRYARVCGRARVCYKIAIIMP